MATIKCLITDRKWPQSDIIFRDASTDESREDRLSGNACFARRQNSQQVLDLIIEKNEVNLADAKITFPAGGLKGARDLLFYMSWLMSWAAQFARPERRLMPAGFLMLIRSDIQEEQSGLISTLPAASAVLFSIRTG
jgi:hypothetical protein